MQPDPRELVARLDALAAEGFSGALCESGRLAEYRDAIVNAYPALRAAVLRCAEMEAVLRDALETIEQAPPEWAGAFKLRRPQFGEVQRVNMRRVLTAPQGEERGT